MDFPPVEKFVEAAQHVNYATSSLTRERLESYLHGWAISIFLTMGYRLNLEDIGAILSHPDWTLSDIIDYWRGIQDPYWSLCSIPIICELIEDLGWKILRPALREILRYCTGDHEWPWYFESPSNYDQLWYCVPYPSRPESYFDMRNIISYYSQYAHRRKPNLRSSYAGELNRILQLNELLRMSLINGPDYLDYEMYDDVADMVSLWQTARKTGLLGGMYELADTSYYDQPGVLKCISSRMTILFIPGKIFPSKGRPLTSASPMTWSPSAEPK